MGAFKQRFGVHMFFLNICVETANPVKHVKVNENSVLGDNSPYQTELMIVTGTLPRGISDISQLPYNYSDPRIEYFDHKFILIGQRGWESIGVAAGWTQFVNFFGHP